MKRRPSESILHSKQIEARLASRSDVFRAAGVDPRPALLQSMAAYVELLLRWNRKINLTAITDVDEIASRNLAESFFGARWLAEAGGTYCDVGSGAGFPGLALQLVRPQWRGILLEPVGKKAAFLAEAGRVVGARHLQVEIARWQDSAIPRESLEAVMARALGGHGELADWAATRLKSGGTLLLWLGSEDAVRLMGLPGWRWEAEPLPGSRRRLLLAGIKQ